ncbi:MAG: 1-acyl-sn-glycerol-3-phosphate acyltransferase [Rickettsiales bacterium]|jgi:1-acyl-sn-glycerol-3-phosphate acyltransferase|nr:1-acyl-sn-glycerol-3-phosphate acyltransferase [Rickettsiales bacterium]
MKILRIVRSAVWFAAFLTWILLQAPTLMLVAPFSRRWGVGQMHIFMAGAAKIFGVRFDIDGKIDEHRPLLLVSNHISIFELIAFPAMFSSGFFSKAEVKKWFPIGWFVKSFGNLFIDRRPTRALQAIEIIGKQMKRAKNPFAIFPEGTTDNGDYVLPFKSAMFQFMADDGCRAKIQPVVVLYRDKNGKKIPPQVLADEYAYFVNGMQTQPPYAKKELSLVSLLWKTLMRGGFLIEVHILPLFDASGLDRKQIAEQLHGIVSAKFQELK